MYPPKQGNAFSPNFQLSEEVNLPKETEGRAQDQEISFSFFPIAFISISVDRAPLSARELERMRRGLFPGWVLLGRNVFGKSGV